MVNRKEKAVGISIFSNSTMVDVSRHGPGITVVEGGVLVTSTGTAYSEFAMIPWFSRRVMSEGINLEWNGSICEARKKKFGSHTYVFIGFFPRFFCGLYHTRVFCIDCKSRELVSRYSVLCTEYEMYRYGISSMNR